MAKSINHVSFIIVFILVLCSISPVFSASPPAANNNYPSLSEKEMGHVQWLLKLSLQPLGDWSYMGGKEEGQEGLESYRYQLGYMAYALALAQYHKTPAYRELYQKAFDLLVQKMVRRDVWYYWEHTSKGAKTTNPALEKQGLGWIDPVVKANIMYSGHLINMLELYQMLYRDAKYDNPKAIKFKWEWVNELVNNFDYDGIKLAEVIHKQFIESPVTLIECELNLVFPVCNQHPLLGLMLYDYNHGTKLASPVKDLMIKSFNDNKLLDPVTRDFMQFYMLAQKTAVGPASDGNNASVGMVMHAWKPDLIEELYPIHVKKVKFADDGTASVKGDDIVGVSSMPSFAGYAKEMGDEKTANGLIRYIEKNCKPEWRGINYLYPRNDEMKITPLFNVMATIAELNVKNGIWSMYNEPWKEEQFKKPFISNVDYPKALVKQAYYDDKKDVIAVTLVPGENGAANTSFSVNQLDKSKVYSINKNGKPFGYLKKGIVQQPEGMKTIEFDKDGILKVSTDFAGEQTFLIKSEI